MALALNTGHALYPHIVALICVENGALVDLKTARTFTLDSGTSFGSGTYGAHFSVTSSGVDARGVEFSPGFAVDGTTNGISVFFAVNSLSISAGYAGSLLGANPVMTYFPNILITETGTARISRGYNAPYGAESTTVFSGAPARTLAVTRNVGDQFDSGDSNLYVNGILEAQGGAANAYATPANDVVERLNSSPSFSGVNAGFVYTAVFSKELTAQETADLHASLTGNNQFALVTGAEAPTNPAQITSTTDAVAFSGGAVVSGTTPAQIAGTTADTLFSGGVVASAPGAASFTTPEGLENNAGSLWLAQAVYWTWTPLGRAGSMSGKVPVDGTGTTHATTGLLTVTGLTAGFGQLDVAVRGATADLDAVYRCYGTAA